MKFHNVRSSFFSCSRLKFRLHKYEKCASGTGHTRYGNNNVYGHDNQLNHFIWSSIHNAKESAFFRFYCCLIKFRRSNEALGKTHFLSNECVTWHCDDWDHFESKYVGFTLHSTTHGDLFIAFNAHDYSLNITLPTPREGKQWYRIVDTYLPSPDDFTEKGAKITHAEYDFKEFSSIILRAK